MPEGHLIHHYARLQVRGLVGATSVTSPQGRFDAEAVKGVLVGIEAYGKHLFHQWSGGQVVHIHLGRVGQFLHHPPSPPVPRPQTRMRVVGPKLTVDLIGPSTCEVIDDVDQEAIIARLGPDPLRPDADPELVWKRIATTDRPIGAVLLDQRVLAGVGNILRAEVLNLVRVHPLRPASQLSRDDFDRLWAALLTMMRRSVEAGRLVTVPEDHPVADTFSPGEGPARLAYRQERCGRCGATLETLEVGGRRINACLECQAR